MVTEEVKIERKIADSKCEEMLGSWLV